MDLRVPKGEGEGHHAPHQITLMRYAKIKPLKFLRHLEAHRRFGCRMYECELSGVQV